MYNHHPYNQREYFGGNRAFVTSTPPVYSPSLVTAVARVEQGFSIPKFVFGGVGGANQSTYGLFKKATTYGFSMWQSKRYVVGMPFNINDISIPLKQTPTTDTLIIPVLNFDDGENVVAGHAIDLASYQDGEKVITLSPYTFEGNVHGDRNFCLELHFRGTALATVTLPISIEIETEEQG